MNNNLFKIIAAIAVIIAAVVYLIPTINPDIWPYKKINLGLDLQGGMHLALEVDTQKAVENTLERISQEVKDTLKKDKIPNLGITRAGMQISIKFQTGEELKKFEKILDKDFGDLRIISRTIKSDGSDIILGLPDKEVTRIKTSSTEQALETIRNRIDQFGISEPDIRIQGEKRIVAQLPGVKDVERAKELIGKTAILEFKLVDDEHDVSAAEKGDIPSGSELLYQVVNNKDTDRTKKTPFLLKKQTLLTGAYLKDAKVQIDSQYNEPHVTIDFDKKGAKLFAKITEENVKKRLAIVLDQNIYSAPVIQEKIEGGAARITGSFTSEEAHDLAIILRAGSLPAPVHVVEERTVGPSLGNDSIKKGLISMYFGGALILIFMALYYSMAGIIADIAVIINLLLLAGGLAAFQATLTLPGLAGIVLTIGIAVDANVLIYERIREELRTGKTFKAAVNLGYERARSTILDANTTTLIAALVLFQFGTGPVKGFAITLSLGVITSVYTALFLTQIIFDYLINNLKITKISI